MFRALHLVLTLFIALFFNAGSGFDPGQARQHGVTLNADEPADGQVCRDHRRPYVMRRMDADFEPFYLDEEAPLLLTHRQVAAVGIANSRLRRGEVLARDGDPTRYFRCNVAARAPPVLHAMA